MFLHGKKQEWEFLHNKEKDTYNTFFQIWYTKIVIKLYLGEKNIYVIGASHFVNVS